MAYGILPMPCRREIHMLQHLVLLSKPLSLPLPVLFKAQRLLHRLQAQRLPQHRPQHLNLHLVKSRLINPRLTHQNPRKIYPIQ